MKHLLWPWVALLAAVPQVAEASCLSIAIAGCVCGHPQVLETETVSVSDSSAEVNLVQELAPVAGPAQGQQTVNAESWDAPGARGIMTTGSEPARRFKIDADEQVLCRDADGDFPVPLADVTSLATSETCDQQLRDRGMKQPPCNDTGRGLGCAAAGGLALSPLLVMAGLLVGRRRR